MTEFVNKFVNRVTHRPILMLFLACLGSAAMFDFSFNGYQPLFLFCFGFSLAFLLSLAYIWYKEGRLNENKIVFLILAVSFLIKLAYALQTGITVRQHDIGSFKDTSYGHAGYIYRIFTEKALPSEIKGQSYHPPLHYVIEAVWIGFQKLLGASFETAKHYSSVPTLFYSCCTAYVSYAVFKELNFKATAVCICTAIVAFHPTFIILSASYNNDMLSVLFMSLVILYVIRWCKKPTLKNILIIALCIGFGMMSKLTAAETAPATALIFLIVFISNKEKLKLFWQYVSFGFVCVPLGMWHSVWMLIKFNRPIGKAMLLSSKLPQYIGFRTAGERIFDFPQSLFKSIYMLRGDAFGNDCYEYNIPSAIVKTSVFGEWHIGEGWWFTEVLAYALIILNIFVIAITLYCGIRCLIRRFDGISNTVRLFVYALYATIMGMYVMFCFNYPHDCSMDFRYIVPTVILGAVFLGMFISDEKHNEKHIQICKKAFICTSYAFCIVSGILFFLCQYAVN